MGLGTIFKPVLDQSQHQIKEQDIGKIGTGEIKARYNSKQEESKDMMSMIKNMIIGEHVMKKIMIVE